MNLKIKSIRKNILSSSFNFSPSLCGERKKKGWEKIKSS